MGRAGWVGLSAALMVACTAGSARADPPRDDTRAYGWQILVADTSVAATATWVTAVVAAVPSLEGTYAFYAPMLSIGLLALFTGPVVHLLHKRYLTALGSLGMRFGWIVGVAATIGIPIDFVIRPNNLNDMFFEGPCIGAAMGFLAATTVDSFVLARARHPRDHAPPLTITPSLTPTRNGALLSLAGRF